MLWKSKCLTCGKEFIVGRYRKGKFCSKDCLFQYQTQVYSMCSELKQSIKQCEKELNRIKRLMFKSLSKDYVYMINHIITCEVCGRTFFASRSSNKYCSTKCINKIKHIKDDKRIYKNGKPDLSITLSKLYERDKGVCNICGITCDWKDIVIRDDGIMIAGESYPSIDHIVPIAKGGKHEWSNVQLLCRHCNAIKRDN